MMLPEPPYYTVIFTSRLRDNAPADYDETALEMARLASTMPGYLGFESARESGLGLAVSYWDSLASIKAWRDNAAHAAARERGRKDWYAQYELRVAKVERQYSWSLKTNEYGAPESNSSDS